MKKISFALFFCLCALAGFAQNSKPLDLKEIVSGEFIPQNISGVIPIPGDGEHYSQMNADKTQIIKYSFKTGKPVEVLFDAATARECPFKKFDSYSFAPDGSKLLIATETVPVYRHSYTAVHYIYSLKRNLDGKINNVVEKLSDGGPQQVPIFSPDGNQVAFVRDNNIFLVKLLYGNSESQVTEDGSRNEVLNGIPDWVYEEEFAFNRALEFSPDSKMLAFIRFDEREVPSYTFPVFAGEVPHIAPYEKYPGEYTYKYPKTGEKNSKVSVHTFDIKSKVTRKINLPLEEGGYIPRIRFTQDPNKLAIMTLNRHQNRFDLYFADPRSTICKLAVRDESGTYIRENVFDNIIFYPETFSFVSERNGYNHLYWYNINGNLIKQVTSGSYEVLDFLGYENKVASTGEVIENAAGVILPGVGAFPDAMAALTGSGLTDAVLKAAETKPFLGICLGMQMLFEESDEVRPCRGLGLLPGRIERIETSLKLPQIGWNALDILRPNAMTEGLENGSYVYFVHSFMAHPADENDLAAVTDYGTRVPAMVARGNLFGCQFHPEKSGEVGLQMLRNFAKLTEVGK